MDPKRCGKRSKRKRKTTPAENGYSTSIWDDNFITEKDHEAYEEWGLEKCFRVLQATPVQLVSIARCMEQKVCDLEKTCRAHIGENTKLKKKLSESENNIGELKRKFEELIFEKSGLMERTEDLKNENSKILGKLHTKEGIVYKLEAEIKELNAKIEELKDEIAVQHNVGFNEAVIQFLTSIPNLKP